MSAAETIQETTQLPPEGDVMLSDAIIAFSQDRDCLETISRLAQEAGWENGCVQRGGVDDLLKWLHDQPPPEFSLIDISGEPDPLEAIRDLCAEYGEDTRIVAIGKSQETGFSIRMREAGAESYITKPLDLEELREVLDLDSDDADQQGITDGSRAANPARGRLITFIGARGGVGASTLAVNYAHIVAHDNATEGPANVMMVDFDLEYGSIALHLDLDPQGALKAALENPERIDSHFLSSAFTEYSETLSIMASDSQVGEDIDVAEDAGDILIRELRPQFTHIICDLPRYRLLDFADAAMMADEVFLVSDLSLIGLRDIMRLRSALERSGCKADLRIVINDPTGQPGQVESDQFARAAGAPVDFTLPYEGGAMNRALNAGKPLAHVAPHARTLPILQRMTGRHVAAKPETFLEKASRWLMGD